MSALLVTRFPAVTPIAMAVAPLVRRGVITDAEGEMLVSLRFEERLAEIRWQERWAADSEAGADA